MAAEPPRRMKVIKDYKSTRDGQADLIYGDVVFVPNFEKQIGEMLQGVSKGSVVVVPRDIVEDTTVVHDSGSATAVKAIKEYVAQRETELSFPEGATMFVVSKVDEMWWHGVYNNKDGMIPASHIQAAQTKKVAPVAAAGGDDVAAAAAPGGDLPATKKIPAGPPSWDWGKLKKERAESELNGEKVGTFLVRASERAANTYVISVVAPGGTVGHIRIHATAEGFQVNKKDPPTATIPQLIAKMTGKDLKARPTGSKGGGTAQTKLVKPLPRLEHGPAPCCYNAKPSGAPSASGAAARGSGGGGLKAAASKLPPAPGPPSKKSQSRGDSGVAPVSGSTAGEDPFGSPIVPAQPVAPLQTPAAAAPMATTPTLVPPRPTSPSETKWVVPDSDLEKFRVYFDGVDTDNDGLVNGKEVMGIFLSSKLSKEQLGAVWALVDISDRHKGSLNVEQFALAMWIIANIVSGQAMPTTLTEVMIPPSLRPGADASGVVTAAEAAAADEAPAGLVLSVKEQAIYDQFWNLAVPDGQESLGAQLAVGFMQASELDNAVLGQIWEIADRNSKGQLVKSDFMVALKLIAVKQAGGEISLDSLVTPSLLPQLGKFNEKAVSAALAIPADQWSIYRGLWEDALKYQADTGPTGRVYIGNGVVELLTKSGLDVQVLGEIWEVADTPPEKGKLCDDEFFVALKLIAVKQGGGVPTMAAMLQPSGPPRLGEDLASIAQKLWAGLGVPQGGDADGGMLKPVMMKSGLEMAVLGQVWGMADSQSRGSLNFTEFEMLCGLVGQAQRGEALNPALVTSSDAAPTFSA